MTTIAFGRRILLAGIVGASLALSPVHADEAPAKADAGSAFYGASFKDLKDGMASMDQFKGKVVVM